MASDSDALAVPERAKTSSVDDHNEAQLLSFLREAARKKAGTIVFKDVQFTAPVPLGAQNLAEVYKGWFKSLKRMAKKKKITLTKVDPENMSTWKVDLLPA